MEVLKDPTVLSQNMVGASLSCTVISKPHIPTLPEESVALHVTAVCPIDTWLPEGKLQAGADNGCPELSMAELSKMAVA
jgi:hypothetical protein